MFGTSFVTFQQFPAEQWERLHLDSIAACESEICSDRILHFRETDGGGFESEDPETDVLLKAGQHELDFGSFLLDA